MEGSEAGEGYDGVEASAAAGTDAEAVVAGM